MKKSIQNATNATALNKHNFAFPGSEDPNC